MHVHLGGRVWEFKWKTEPLVSWVIYLPVVMSWKLTDSLHSPWLCDSRKILQVKIVPSMSWLLLFDQSCKIALSTFKGRRDTYLCKYFWLWICIMWEVLFGWNVLCVLWVASQDSWYMYELSSGLWDLGSPTAMNNTTVVVESERKVVRSRFFWLAKSLLE